MVFAASATQAHNWMPRIAAAEAGCADIHGKKKVSGYSSKFQANDVTHQFVKSVSYTTQV